MENASAAADARESSAWFADLSQQLMADRDEVATQQRICDLAVGLIEAADLCGITVRRRRGRLDTVARTDEIAARCDELQYELGEGPCVDAARRDEPFLVTSTAEDPRWPRWGPRAAELGAHALLSVQLSAPGMDPSEDPLGAINLYARRVAAFDERDLDQLLVFGIHAANALSAVRMVTTLAAAVDSRHQIGIAQGILMQRYQVDASQAFELLQRYSSNGNVKLRDVAQVVVRSGELPASYDELTP